MAGTKALGGFYNEGYYFKGDKAITYHFRQQKLVGSGRRAEHLAAHG
jgi:hypothetical protein